MDSFVKFSGCGNDFVIFHSLSFSLTPALIQKICDRKRGIGADGVILLHPSQKADFKMIIFNADGSEAEMCGNGLRCLIQSIKQLFPSLNDCLVETRYRVHQGSFQKDLVKVEMGKPTDVQWNLQLPLEGQTITCHFLDTGVPHCVIFTEDVSYYPLATLGPIIRHHPLFGSRGTNVNVVSLAKDSSRLHIRTYERGVEAETQACGTGATACAIAAAYLFNFPSPVAVQFSSKDQLVIDFKLQDGEWKLISQIGPADFVFSGTVDLSQL